MLVLESTINSENFAPKTQGESRLQLLGDRLPNYAKLIGICGGLNQYHGIDLVLDGVLNVLQRRDDIYLIIAGTPSKDIVIPEHPRVIYLGNMPHHQMNAFYSAMDVVIVSLSDTPFGYYAFPQKVYEVISSRVPLVAADVGALGRLLWNYPQLKYTPHDADSLVKALLGQIDQSEVVNIKVPTWADQAERLHEYVKTIANCSASTDSRERQI